MKTKLRGAVRARGCVLFVDGMTLVLSERDLAALVEEGLVYSAGKGSFKPLNGVTRNQVIKGTARPGV